MDTQSLSMSVVITCMSPSPIFPFGAKSPFANATQPRMSSRLLAVSLSNLGALHVMYSSLIVMVSVSRAIWQKAAIILELNRDDAQEQKARSAVLSGALICLLAPHIMRMSQKLSCSLCNLVLIASISQCLFLVMYRPDKRDTALLDRSCMVMQQGYLLYVPLHTMPRRIAFCAYPSQ